jgi:hypothetical protein
LVFHFISSFNFCTWFYMTSPLMWPLWVDCEVLIFFKIILTRSIVLKIGVKTPINKNNSTSLILTNLEFKFEACMLNLIWKCVASYTVLSYIYFPRFSYFFGREMDFFQIGQKLQKLVKKIEGILGVKWEFCDLDV